MVLVEVAANGIQSALAAQKGGALRVELCANLLEGGTTPTKSQIELVRENVDVALNVIVRPRGGDFLYDHFDFELMKKDVSLCADMQCDGVVLGILNADGTIDVERNRILVGIAKEKGLSVTFHRAFGRSCDLFLALDDVVSLGCDRVLTSGGYTNAFDGRFVIKELVDRAGRRVIIMPGSGVNEDNVSEIIRVTKACEIHGTFQDSLDGNMLFRNPRFSSKLEYHKLVSSASRIEKIVKLSNSNSF